MSDREAVVKIRRTALSDVGEMCGSYAAYKNCFKHFYIYLGGDQ